MNRNGRLKHVESGRIVASRAEVAASMGARLRGWIARAPETDVAIGWVGSDRIHTFGVRAALDIVICRADGRVRALTTIAPNRIGPAVGPGEWAWETVAGVLSRTVAVGDTLRFEGD